MGARPATNQHTEVGRDEVAVEEVGEDTAGPSNMVRKV